MPLASGLAAQVGLFEETTYGTFGTPTRFFEFTSESLSLERERIESRGLRAGRRVLHRWAPGVGRVAGDVDMEMAAQGFGVWLKHIFGSVVTTGVGPFVHTATPGDLAGDSLTVQVGRPDIGGTVRAFSYTGCKVTKADLAARVNEYATLKVGLYGAHEDTSQSLAVAAYPATLSPFTFVHGALTVAAGAVDVREATVSIDNGLAVDRHFLRSTTPERPKESLEATWRTVTGTLDADFTDLTAYNRFVNGTEAALSLTFNAGASAILTVAANVRFDGATPTVGGAELLTQPLPWKALSTTSDAAAVTVTLTNGDSAP